MKTPRATVIPLVVGVVACLAIVAYVTTGIGMNEFGSAVRTVDRKSIPAVADLYKSLHPHLWLLPAVALVVGAAFLFKRKTNSALIAWYVSVSIFAGLAMTLLTLLSWYLLSADFVLRGIP